MFEKMVCNKITPVVSVGISSAQHGFMRGRSTVTNLTGRTQRVKMEDYLSESVYSNSGVPQGSHLGHLFFIDDMDSVFRIIKHALGYADDLQLFKRIIGVDDFLRFQSDLDRL
jgi:hypothetical protein